MYSRLAAATILLPLCFLLGAGETMPVPKGPSAPGCPRAWTGTLERGQAVIVGQVGPAEEKASLSYTSVVKTQRIVRSRGLKVPTEFLLKQQLIWWEPTNEAKGHIIENHKAILVIQAVPGEREFVIIEGSECRSR
jgi:hypothetical protein